ncbi:MAG: hypothetical protein M0016_07075 [Deltaproteobacteria bacterium]|jgi:hypothetical protein|nr:hypothetical protein [Deltaproteobacteria bacterium]MCL5880581.1 hypothetical protein [Deltaproteobacteria bacterium]MDA8304908.1 hypothetical protein [Deltaproteobacteria bacterium]
MKYNKLNKFYKYKYLVIYLLSNTLIICLLSGCAQNAPSFGLRHYDDYRGADKLKKEVLRDSFKLNNIPDNKIKNILNGKNKKKQNKHSVKLKPLLYPAFISNSNISLKKHKMLNNYKIRIGKIVKSQNGKFKLMIKSVRIEGIFELINFSIINLSNKTVNCQIELFKKSKSGAKGLPFKSNLKDKMLLGSFNKITGETIFLAQKDLSKIRLAAYINYDGNNKLDKLVYKF